MRLASAAWERAAEVRAAARGWRRAGAIDEATLDAIDGAFPDPCVRPSLVWRVLTAGMVTAVILCSLGAFWIATRAGETGLIVLLCLLAVACVVAAERMEASPRLARRGAAGATSFWAVVFLLAAVALYLLGIRRVGDDDALAVVLLTGALAWGAVAWRWGHWLHAGLSAASLLFFLARLPQGRLVCLVAGAGLAALAARRLDDAGWAPSYRRAALAVVVTGLVAAYAAINVYSLDTHLLERLGHPGTLAARSSRFFALSAVGTAVFPLVVLAWGIGSRRTFLVDTGIVLLALSLLTLQHYVAIAPLWALLAASGAALVVLALVIERALRRAREGEILGFTADPLFSDLAREDALQALPVAAVLAPPAADLPAEKPDFAGGGGRFGGGGATEKF
jgi:hypothetical protein